MSKPVPISTAFGQALKRCREKKGLSKQQLAYEAEVDVRTIKRLEAGESGIGIFALFRIAAALQVPASQLIKETESQL